MSLLPPRLSRYTAVAILLARYGRGLSAQVEEPPLSRSSLKRPEEDDPQPEALAADLERLGPTFVKLGQLLSTRGDLLPPPYLDALARLQDDVSAFPFAEAQAIIESELGTRLSKLFAEFEETPLAAASLGQVHRARLRDGRPVAVKVQRPGIHERVHEDVEALREIAELLDRHIESARRYNVVGVVEEFRQTLLSELDYRREAANLQLIGGNLAEFSAIVVPAPVEGYTTARVLTMEYVPGTKVTELSPLLRVDIDGTGLAETLIRAYLKQIILDGVFHADPHPGNVLLTGTGRLALVDLGMVGRISPAVQDRLLKLLLAVSEGRGQEAAEATAALGERTDAFDDRAFRREISAMVDRYAHESLATLRVGRIFIELQAACASHGLRAPAELTLLGKTLLTLDQVARALDADLDVNAAMRRDANALMMRRLRKVATSGGVFATLLEAREFAERLPGRINQVLDALSTSELKLKVELIDEGAVIDGLQKVANRIALALVLAALIVGAAMLTRVETAFRLFGYPGVAMILFLMAAMGAVWLAADIVRHDRVARRR